MRKIVALVITCLLLSTTAFAAGTKATLPKGYEKWERSSEKIETDKSSLFYGIHYIYVDKKAMPAYKRGTGYPEGSTFVIEYFNIKNEGGRQIKGKKNMIVLMKRDKSQRNTGGWLFAGFTPDGSLSRLDVVKNCFECHVQEAKNRDYVISRFSDFKK
ncbi:MAG: cytochrome P460 family protein [Desulfuromonadales bacterium]|nr:cytochrome P460 family protein [Desulfuromonadales bacterium]